MLVSFLLLSFDAHFFVSLLGVVDLGSQDKGDYLIISFFELGAFVASFDFHLTS